jgi:ESS family glutamate:Na+ symporter
MIISDLIIFLCAFIIALILKKIFYKYIWLLPASIIAGFLTLISSQQLLEITTLSTKLNFYIDILLAIIFSTFPLSIKNLNPTYIKSVKKLWQYSALQYFSQWGISLFLVTAGFFYAWPLVTDTFGLVLPAGFAGGHGSAAVVGDLLFKLGNTNALTLTMAMATIGAVCSVTGGMFWIFWAKRKGIINVIDLKAQNQKLNLKADLKTISIVFLIVGASFIAKPYITELLKFEIPIFVVAVAVSIILRLIPIKLNLDDKTIASSTNIATDLLVCIGIASIQLLIVSDFLIPLLIMSSVGILLCIIYFRKLALNIFEEDSFSKALFTWGWSVGGLVFGLALVKIINPEDNIKIMQQFALTYLLLAPIEISLLLTMPYLVHNGYGLYISVILIIMAAILIKTLRKRTDK